MITIRDSEACIIARIWEYNLYGRRRQSWGYNKTNCICMPVEEEHNQIVAEQWIEKIVNKQGKANFLRRTAFTERSEKLSLLKDIEEILWRNRKRKRKQRRKRNGNGNRDENEEKNKQEKGKRKRKATKSEGEEEKNTMQINNEENRWMK